MARISALGTPKESRARGSAMSSMLCSLSGLACLVILALAMLASIGSHEPDPLPMIVALGGLVLSSLGGAGDVLRVYRANRHCTAVSIRESWHISAGHHRHHLRAEPSGYRRPVHDRA